MQVDFHGRKRTLPASKKCMPKTQKEGENGSNDVIGAMFR
jgi:hypothetical protein